MKRCPYCNAELLCGHLNAMQSSSIYWLPQGINYPHFLLNKKSIEEAGGAVLGKNSRVGFLATDKPKTYLCKKCEILITCNKTEII